MRFILIATIFVTLPFFLSAQTITISGKVLDKENDAPLVFASIGVKGKSIGTVSNSLGEFDFHVPPSYKDDLLVISMLGYENLQTPISNLLNRDTVVFKLNKAVQMLDEVVIQDSLSGEDIARVALNRISENYPMRPFLVDGFYRDLKKIGGTYFSLLEAAVKIYDKGYEAPKNKTRLRERVELMEVRKSLGYNSRFTKYFDQNNLLEDLLLHNNLRYRQFPEEEAFYSAFKRSKTSYFNGRKVFVIYQRQANFFLRMYIDVRNYAVIRLEYQRYYDDAIIKKKRDKVSKYIYDKKTIDFKEYQGKMFVNYMNLESKINWYDEKTDSLQFETELHQELLINRVYPNSDERIGSTQKMRRYGLQYQDEPYNKEFWSNYNVIKETPLDKKIIADLEQLGALDDQFEKY
ncbi:carboxypeptidase-like regulatory domain-containing protein [Fulvivirga sp. RKSG066]|uniref:carboxypeptidase-like regulatory domain-containing protein n=1 Tax=Fulvivirga aurantia TaxID=2529383 RepID=UPI0012BD5EBF|nr:carboxypeptidase-like regulatory domain-containing protein [Fulvivirga aurantia]MTI23183.1 carboxypeptidase-like regulatory domain-containing protein [Fulvivirga aurantia]